VGNLLLTVLAFYLAFTHSGPLTPLIFLTIAVCILAGNALPISVYLILVQWRQAELRAEAAQAGVLLRDSLARSEEVLDRLDEAEGSLSKSILVARQVPERIRESFEALEELNNRLSTMELETFTETLKGQGVSLGELKTALEAMREESGQIQAGFKDIRKEMKSVPGSVEKLVAELADSRRGGSGDELDTSVGERLDLLFESLESVQDSLDSLLQRVVELKIAATPPPFPPKEEEPVPEPRIPAPAPEIEPEPIAADDELAESEEEDQLSETGTIEDDLDEAEEEAVAEEEDEQEFEEDLVQEEEPQPEAPEPPKPVTKKAARKRVPKETVSLKSEGESDSESSASDGRTRLVAHAMIGMYNKLFIRGDEPWLSWDDGRQMELIGIGEFAWTIDDLKEPIEVTVLLNDDIPAEEGNFRLEPGKTTRISPRFPKG